MFGRFAALVLALSIGVDFRVRVPGQTSATAFSGFLDFRGTAPREILGHLICRGAYRYQSPAERAIARFSGPYDHPIPRNPT
jgi:hypothetical protein